MILLVGALVLMLNIEIVKVSQRNTSECSHVHRGNYEKTMYSLSDYEVYYPQMHVYVLVNKAQCAPVYLFAKPKNDGSDRHYLACCPLRRSVLDVVVQGRI